MSYILTEVETFKGGPTAWERINYERSKTFVSLDEVFKTVKTSIDDINHRYTILRSWNERKGARVTTKVLFKRQQGTGRLLRRFEITEYKKPVIEEISLI